MGVSTDGILFFGFLIDEYEECPWYYESAKDDNKDWRDWEEFYVEKKGLKEPASPYDESKEEHQKFWRDSSDLTDVEPVEISRHCSSDYPMYYITVKEGHYSNNRGFATEIPSLDTKPEWIEQLKTFCEFMGITYKEPKWYLVSYWG